MVSGDKQNGPALRPARGVISGRAAGSDPYQPHFWPLFCWSSQVFSGAK